MGWLRIVSVSAVGTKTPVFEHLCVLGAGPSAEPTLCRSVGAQRSLQEGLFFKQGLLHNEEVQEQAELCARIRGWVCPEGDAHSVAFPLERLFLSLSLTDFSLLLAFPWLDVNIECVKCSGLL